MAGPAVTGTVVLLAGLGAALGWLDWLTIAQWAGSHAGWLVVFSLAGALLITAWIRAARRASLAVVSGAPTWVHAAQRVSQATPTVLRWWMVVAAAAVVVAAVAWGATSWLLHEASHADDPSAARIEAIKIGLSIGAGTGGVFALLLAVRRQWHQERDASEKQVTELYTKASDQLGSDKAAVRLAGLYALERVAQNAPHQRQTVINVLCAYLRMPYQPPDSPPNDDQAHEKYELYREQVQEREVRLTAQRLLTLWPDIDVNLTNAVLINLDLTKCRLHTANFHNAHFIGDAWFTRTHFTGETRFDKAQFTGKALFYVAQFTHGAQFNDAQFADEAHFNGTQPTNEVTFYGAKFARGAWFDEDEDAQFIRFIRGMGDDDMLVGPFPPNIPVPSSQENTPSDTEPEPPESVPTNS